MTDKITPKEVKAFARYIHVAPRKLRLVANMIRLASVDVALEQLRFSSKKAALPLAKAINSAIANAIHNFDLNRDNLYIKSLTVDGGPVYKRYAPRAQGRAFTERKRTSHISVILGSRDSKPKNRRSIFSLRPKTAEIEIEEVKSETQPAAGKVADKQQVLKQVSKPSEKIKQNIVNLKRRLFNRKSGQ